MRHALSVDVEDWYHDGGGSLSAGLDQRVETNVQRLLELFAAGGARATFFFLGEVAERYPALVRSAVGAGHEVGSHGYRHTAVRDLLRSEFRDDVTRSLRVLEDLTGGAVRGYRAPYFSIKAGVCWPVEILAELGLRYDSSILPIDRPPGLELVCPRAPFRLENGLWEVPVGVFRILFWHLPLASGAGLRLLPAPLLQRCLRRFESEVGAGVFYVHPWELDAGSPTSGVRGRWLLRVGRHRLARRLEGLFATRAFAPICEVFADLIEESPRSGGAIATLA